MCVGVTYYFIDQQYSKSKSDLNWDKKKEQEQKELNITMDLG